MSSDCLLKTMEQLFLDARGFQKHPPRGIPRKRFFENIQQIYRRTSMPTCDVSKVGKKNFNQGVNRFN